jgi:hypothetical protein
MQTVSYVDGYRTVLFRRRWKTVTAVRVSIPLLCAPVLTLWLTSLRICPRREENINELIDAVPHGNVRLMLNCDGYIGVREVPTFQESGPNVQFEF